MSLVAVPHRVRAACRSRRPQALRPLVRPLLMLPLLAACAAGGPGPGSAQARADQETVAACRQRADQAYDITHRDQIYASGSQVDTPFSANYQPGVPDRGLSDLFQRDQMVSDCVRNTGVEGDRTPTQPPAPAPPVPHS